jgi:plasmid rolling circle replication initiator protein Rep
MLQTHAVADTAKSVDVHLTTVSPKDKPWDVLGGVKDRVQQLLLTDPSLSRYAERLKECSWQLGFNLVPDTNPDKLGVLNHRLISARFCRVRLCPICSWRKQLAWRGRFFHAVPKIRQDYPAHRWLFLTLTIANVPIDQLGQAITDLNAGWTRLTKLRSFPAIGFFRSLEVTREVKRPEFAHPHIHALLLVPASYFSTGYISQDKWRSMWRDSIRTDYAPSVNIKAIKPKVVNSEDPNSDGLTEAILSTLSYHVKGAKSTNLYDDAPWFVELFKQMERARTVSTGGVLRKYIKDTDPEDLINLEGNPDLPESNDITIWYQWRKDIQRYTMR